MIEDVHWFVGIDWQHRAIVFACWMLKEGAWLSERSSTAEPV